MVRSRVELFEEIRVDHRREGLSIRELATRFKVHRRTVRQALACATPPPRKEYSSRGRPAIEPWKDVIDGWLIADAAAPKKQQHTARRVWQRLVAEHGADVSEVSVSRYVAVRRRELGLARVEVFVPQDHAPGAEAEVDFGEFHIRLRGQDLKVWMFVMRLSACGKAFHHGFANQAQEAFLEGHVRAFEHLTGSRPGLGTTTSSRPSCGSSRVGTGSRTTASPRCVRTTGSSRSSATRARTARTRRAASRARSAGSVART